MRISEIFLSIEGEGIRTGYPAIFIRTYGCNIHCSYCDSLYAINGDEYVDISTDTILAQLQRDWPWCTRVTLTGGEPLMQPESIELVKRLLKLGYEVNIETNGAVDLSVELLADKDILEYRPNLIITMDWKSTSSKMSKYMCTDNLGLLKPQDVLKFVVGSEDDLNQMAALLNVHEPICNVFVSPIFGEIEPVDIVNYVIDHKLEDVRTQVQLHKIIWSPDKRGV